MFGCVLSSVACHFLKYNIVSRQASSNGCHWVIHLVTGLSISDLVPDQHESSQWTENPGLSDKDHPALFCSVHHCPD